MRCRSHRELVRALCDRLGRHRRGRRLAGRPQRKLRRSQGIRGRCGVLHGLPQRRRVGRRDVRKRNSCFFAIPTAGQPRWRVSGGGDTRRDRECAVQHGWRHQRADGTAPGPCRPAGRHRRAPRLARVPWPPCGCRIRTWSSPFPTRRARRARPDRPPLVEPALPDGQNVEFVATIGDRHLRMRVHERGVGETRSCGTGICAAVVAAATADGTGRDGSPWQVDVPGGTCRVVWHPDGTIELIGPAVIVAEIDLDDDWLAGPSPGESGGRRVPPWTTTMTEFSDPHVRRHRRLRARGTPGAAPGGRSVDRAAGRHRGRVPPAAAGAGRARRRLDGRHRWPTPRTRWPSWPAWPRPPARSCSTG